MRWINKMRLRLRSLLRRPHVEQELNSELQFHLEQQIEENLAAGMSREEAQHAARRTFGNVASLKEEARDTWGLSLLTTLWQDISYGIRTLSQSPGFTAVVVVSLALGIGANTTVFSVVNAILLRSLPYEDPERIVVIQATDTQSGQLRSRLAEDYHAWEEENQVFERIAYWLNTVFTVKNDGGAQLIEGQLVSASLFSMLGVQPMLGRNFLPEDANDAAAPAVILSYRLWERLFEKDPNAIGKNLRIDLQNATVVGVMPPGFFFANEKALMWQTPPRPGPGYKVRDPIARLKPGVSIEQAQVAMEMLAARRAQEYPETSGDLGVKISPLHEASFTGAPLRERLFIFSCAVGFVLLIACANVAGLLLVRSSSRRKEMATRLALGAGRWRLVRQLLTESTLLAVAGGALGVAVAYGGLKVLLSFNPDNHQFGGRFFPRMNEAGIDGEVLGYTLLISLLTGLVAGIAPAFKGSKHNLNEASRGTTPDSGQQRSSSLLVVAQVALALVLLIGAGLMINSFVRLQSVDVGFNPDDVLTFRLNLTQREWANHPESFSEAGQHSGSSRITNFHQQVLERVRAVPGVESAAGTDFLPLSHQTYNSFVGVDGRPPIPMKGVEGVEMLVRHNRVMGDFFQTLGIPLLRGRDFTSQDSAEAPGVVVISEGMARRYWPDQDPIGRQLVLQRGHWGKPDGPVGRPLRVVGVVGDIHHWNLQDDPRPSVYVPTAQVPAENSRRILRMGFMARTSSEAASLIPAVRAAVAGVDSEVPIYAVAPMERFYLIWTGESRFYTLLLGVFAGLALILSAIGVYGVMAHSVTRRTHEIGIRMALGAQSSEVLKAVMRWGVALTMIGVALGLVAAFTLTRVTGAFGLTPVDVGEIDSVLYGITPIDPATFFAVSFVMTTVALLACYIPARRATKVSPMVALRHE